MLAIACTTKKVDLQYMTVPWFKTDSLVIYDNHSISDSMLVDFDNDGIPDLSICGYSYSLGAGQFEQKSFFRLNALNPDYGILSEIQKDTICTDTTILNNILNFSSHNCSSPDGNVITGTYAISSKQFLTVPDGIYNSGMVTILDYKYLSSQVSSNSYYIALGNSYEGYFFIKNLNTKKVYAIELGVEFVWYYILKNIILLS